MEKLAHFKKAEYILTWSVSVNMQYFQTVHLPNTPKLPLYYTVSSRTFIEGD